MILQTSWIEIGCKIYFPDPGINIFFFPLNACFFFFPNYFFLFSSGTPITIASSRVCFTNTYARRYNLLFIHFFYENFSAFISNFFIASIRSSKRWSSIDLSFMHWLKFKSTLLSFKRFIRLLFNSSIVSPFAHFF